MDATCALVQGAQRGLAIVIEKADVWTEDKKALGEELDREEQLSGFLNNFSESKLSLPKDIKDEQSY